MAVIAKRDGFEIDTDAKRLDLPRILGWLRGSYWAGDIAADRLALSFENSAVWGVYGVAAQVGFARAVTDYARFAFLSDVWIDEAARGNGLGTWMVDAILNDPRMVKVTNWTLGTRDAHGLYEKFGFVAADPAVMMQRRR